MSSTSKAAVLSIRERVFRGTEAHRTGGRGPFLSFRIVGLWFVLSTCPGLMALCLAAEATPAAQPAACRDDQILELALDTANGVIEIALDEAAAPNAVRRLIALARGPIDSQALFGDNQVGYYDGLVFDYTKPHVEIITAERTPAGLTSIPQEIDADALGLHARRIADVHEAMDALQLKILKRYNITKNRGERTAKLSEWVDHWQSSGNAAFLVGVSHKEINEALGYHYSTGLNSRPVVRGAVALKPRSPSHATPRLSILLQDIPSRTGEWMVVGQVTAGLDIADQISLAPLVEPRHIKPKDYLPLEPIEITKARISCR